MCNLVLRARGGGVTTESRLLMLFGICQESGWDLCARVILTLLLITPKETGRLPCCH